jgi:hypothetical protein
MSFRDQDQNTKAGTGSDLGSANEKVDFVESNVAPQHHTLKRQLKNRHVAMIRYSQPLSVLCEGPLSVFVCLCSVLEVCAW